MKVNKQQAKQQTDIHVYIQQTDMYVHVLMSDEKEERKKQARSNKQTRTYAILIFTMTCAQAIKRGRLL